MSWKFIPALIVGMLMLGAADSGLAQPAGPHRPFRGPHRVGPIKPGLDRKPVLPHRVAPRPIRRSGPLHLRRPLPQIPPRGHHVGPPPRRFPFRPRPGIRHWPPIRRHVGPHRPPIFRPPARFRGYGDGGYLFRMPWDLNRVRGMLRADPMAIRRRNPRGETLLHLAVKQARPELVRLLLAHGAFINAQTRFGATPLHYAAYFGRPHIARILIRRGANRYAQDRWHRTALQVAGQRRKMGVFFLLRRFLGR
ncbi:MAG: ankyrin repeat domain-containing protein [Proteobacteria bacterium]|nr:ankyrin repeat domain-containing protein [Pseudomonadota bacterium]MBU1742941.1 ankyrin repeat domain-containing protein [Pseudomonadota bacterium]